MIRAYAPKDKQAVLHLFDLNCPNYFSRTERKDLEHYLNHQREDYFVFTDEGLILGAGGLNYKLNSAVISWDIIHPEHHNKGIGKALLQWRLKHVERKSIRETIVRTSQLTHEFYGKQGFLLQEIKRDYWAKGFDLYFMRYSSFI